MNKEMNITVSPSKLQNERRKVLCLQNEKGSIKLF